VEPKTLLDPQIVDVQEWNELISHPCFKKLEQHIESKIKNLRMKAEQLAVSPSMDSAIQLVAINSRIDELKKLLSKSDFLRHEKVKLQKENKI